MSPVVTEEPQSDEKIKLTQLDEEVKQLRQRLEKTESSIIRQFQDQQSVTEQFRKDDLLRTKEITAFRATLQSTSEKGQESMKQVTNVQDKLAAEQEKHADHIVRLENKIKELEKRTGEVAQRRERTDNLHDKLNEETSRLDEKINTLEINLRLDEDQSSTAYWENAEDQPNNTPLVKEKPSHNCVLIPTSTKILLIILCLFNYLDTVTDVGTAVDMFKGGKYVLGSLSVIVMVAVGWITSRRFRRKWSWRKILALCTFSSTQHFIFKKFLKHPKKPYDRWTCQTYNSQRCKTIECNNIRHKLRHLYLGIIVEKMWENQPQFILQIINFAPEYLSTSPTSPIVRDNWYYWKLTSLLITLISLARSCVSYNFYRNELRPGLFSFYSIGKGWKALHPQKWLLFVIHATVIAIKFLTVTLLMLLVNHDFSQEVRSGSCSLSTALRVIRSQSESSCYFETKAAWLLFLYMLAYYLSQCMIAMIAIPIFYSDSVREKTRSVGLRVRFFLKLSGDFLWLACIQYPIVLVLQQRHFMESSTNHLSNAQMMTFGIKILPSLLQASGTVIFTVIIYTRGDDSFNNVDIGISPFHLALVAVGIEILHLLCLLAMVYRADPQHSKFLSDEKMLETLIKMKKIDDTIDLSCSKKAKEIIREAIRKNGSFDVFQENIREEIVRMAREPPSDTPDQDRMERFHGTGMLSFKEAVLAYNEEENSRYTPFQQHPEDEGVELEANPHIQEEVINVVLE